MKLTRTASICSFLILILASANLQACPLPEISMADRMTAFSQSYNSGGLIGSFGSGGQLEKQREANCLLHQELVRCGSDSDTAKVWIMNKDAFMPAITQALVMCAQRPKTR